jgi:hypothetical protein
MKRIFLGGAILLGAVSFALAEAAEPASDPAAPCPACEVRTKTICVGEHTTKITIKPAYSKVCEPLCLPKCSFHLGFHHSDDSCPNCECARKKYYLVVRPCKEERAAVVCKPVEVEDCGKKHCRKGAACADVGDGAALPVKAAPEPLPAPKAPEKE